MDLKTEFAIDLLNMGILDEILSALTIQDHDLNWRSLRLIGNILSNEEDFFEVNLGLHFYNKFLIDSVEIWFTLLHLFIHKIRF